VSDSVVGLSRDLAYVAVARLFRRRVLAHFHSLHYGAARGARVFHVPAVRLLARLAAERIALAPTAAAELGRLGVDCRWIINPLPSEFENGAGSPREQYDGEAGSLRLLYVGTYGKKKGCDDLIEALARARAEGIDASVRFVGKEMYRGEGVELARQIEDSALEDAVEFVGVKAPEELPEFYTSADVICLPSTQEGLPMSLLEGMSFGLPALATTVGCIPDLVTSSTGVLVPPRRPDRLLEAIRLLSRDPDARARMGAAARRHVLELAAPEKLAGEWCELYAKYA
jgi:glycosyltransferase involved in cell wall biosynthesis